MSITRRCDYACRIIRAAYKNHLFQLPRWLKRNRFPIRLLEAFNMN